MRATIYLFLHAAPWAPLLIDKKYAVYYNRFMPICHGLSLGRCQIHRVTQPMLSGVFCALALFAWGLSSLDSQAWGQSISSVRSFDGGVAPLFNLTGPGNLYLDNQGTQGFLYNPGSNFQSYSFRNPTTGQAWSGAVTTLGPQLSIGLIQGANQGGSALVLPGPPRQAAPVPSIQSNLLDEIP